MLDAFLDVDAASIDAVQRFLDTYGDFSGPLRKVTLWELGEWQRVLKDMRLYRPFSWKNVKPVVPLNLALQMEWAGNEPQWRLETMSCLQAMAAVIYLDHAKGLRFGVCRSRVCGKIFAKTTGHKKNYCDRTCQHREVVRSATLAAKKAKKAARRVRGVTS